MTKTTIRRLRKYSVILAFLMFIFTLQFVFLPTNVFSAAGDVVVNEVAWAGTDASDSDEWIELYNTTGSEIDITDWTLTATDGTPAIVLSGTIPAGGYFLLERSDDNTVKDIVADQIYTGGLGNTGETLELRNSSSELIDSVNPDGGGWPAGTNSPAFSMERVDPMSDGSDTNWLTNDGVVINGTDAVDGAIMGTPKAQNSAQAGVSPTPTEIPSPTPTDEPLPTPTTEPSTNSVVINEVAWAGTVASASDEWIELYNASSSEVDVTDWTLNATDGSPQITLSGVVPAGGYFLLERSDDNTVKDIIADQIYTGALGDTGETLELRNADNELIDTANSDGDYWPAGDGNNKMSMERVNPTSADTDENWGTNDGYAVNGIDANDNVIFGTPKAQNSVYGEVPSPTPTEEISPTPTEELSPTPTDETTPTPTEELAPTTQPEPTSTPSPTPTPSTRKMIIGIFGFGTQTQVCVLEYQLVNFGFFRFYFPSIVCYSPFK